MNSGQGPDLLGVCEVENEFVMQQLAAVNASMPGRTYAVHADTADQRGHGRLHDEPFDPSLTQHALSSRQRKKVFNSTTTRRLLNLTWPLLGTDDQPAPNHRPPGRNRIRTPRHRRQPHRSHPGRPHSLTASPRGRPDSHGAACCPAPGAAEPLKIVSPDPANVERARSGSHDVAVVGHHDQADPTARPTATFLAARRRP